MKIVEQEGEYTVNTEMFGLPQTYIKPQKGKITNPKKLQLDLTYETLSDTPTRWE